jgi:asparagine synthase (glutamine-hydrolysing)
LSFSDPAQSKEEEITEKLFHLIKNSVDIRAAVSSEPAVFLSGGMDSSTVLAFVKEANDNPLKTFSYRCQSETFDESRYARLMAEHTGSDHHEIEYTPHNVLLMPEIIYPRERGQ